jgi:hypothetical protein
MRIRKPDPEGEATALARRQLKMVELLEEVGLNVRLSYTVPGFAMSTGLGESSIWEAIREWRKGDPDGLPLVERKGRTLILREDGLRWLRAGRPGAGTVMDPIERKLDAIEHKLGELTTLLESDLGTMFREVRDRLDNLLAEFARADGKFSNQGPATHAETGGGR